MNKEQAKMWETLKTLPYDINRDGVKWLDPVQSRYELYKYNANDGDLSVAMDTGELYMYLTKEWKCVSDAE